MQNSITNVREKNKNGSLERLSKNVNKNCIINNSTFERKNDEQQFLFWYSNFAEILSHFLVEFFSSHIYFAFISRYFFFLESSREGEGLVFPGKFIQKLFPFFSQKFYDPWNVFTIKIQNSITNVREKNKNRPLERSSKNVNKHSITNNSNFERKSAE